MPDSAELGSILLAHARAAIELKLGLPVHETHDHPSLHAPGASFVTLIQHGTLRGCIGHLQPIQPLGKDVHDNAQAAAFRDPRFMPVEIDEWPDIKIEVSVLGPTTFTRCPTEEDCLRQIVPRQDGVILVSGARQATFLPQVWEHFHEPQEFIAHLMQKAGLPVSLWPSDMQVGRYQVQLFKDPA
jgi:uncharacterized protein